MPNALMEAMMRGVPCIATNISGCQDLIADQVNGLLVPVADVGRLAAAIVYMLEHPEAAAAMGAKARETVCRDFTIQLVAEKYAALYKSLVPSVNQTLVL
jgi:Glycosyltransferase